MKDENPNSDLIFLHCIIHQESLCKYVLQLDHVTKTVVKLVNLIRARGLNHRQFIQLLEESGAEHMDSVVPLQCLLTESGKGASSCVRVERRDHDISGKCR